MTILSALSPAEKSLAMSQLLARNWWVVLLRGVAGIVFGLAAIFMPIATLATLVVLFAAYLLVDGVLAIVSAIRAARRHERWGFFVLEGLVDLVAAAAVFLAPGAALFVFIFMAAAWGVLSGVLMLISAFSLHRTHGRLWMIIGGVASIAWGCLLATFPITGLVILTWWLGAYAFIFGLTLVVLAFTLRSRLAPAAEASQASLQA
jgi:uncharacterized membrane protein HdeD (DUF308 family)